MFLNLIVNAGQAIEASGTITISTGASEIWIRFEDTGCGIPKEHLNRIFEPLFTTKPVGQETGLGLSVSYSIVRGHGGWIDVESKVGRGSPVHHSFTGAATAHHHGIRRGAGQCGGPSIGDASYAVLWSL